MTFSVIFGLWDLVIALFLAGLIKDLLTLGVDKLYSYFEKRLKEGKR